MEKAEFRILVFDDVESIRAAVSKLLGARGYQVNGVSSVRELLRALQGPPFNVIFLDILLPKDLRIRAVSTLFQEMFPDVSFPEEEVMTDFNLTHESRVSGRYLLPLVKAVSPASQVIMLSGDVGAGMSIEDEAQYLKKYGALETFQKNSEDPRFSTDHENLMSLDRELTPYLDDLFQRVAADLRG